ncbi:MAG: hypothetical protein K9M57_04275 [Phycisphaerae bacterium]|nr:hypothetical protein [Phycisphaerae bacterium]
MVNDDNLGPESGNERLEAEIDSNLENESPAEETAEEGRPLSHLFPDDFTFPPVDEMDAGQLDEKLTAIEDIFEANYIELALVDGLPDRLIYQFLIEDALQEPMDFSFGPDDSSICCINGCGGDCPTCFQKDYCDIALDRNLDGY